MDRRLLLKLGAACLGTAAARPALGFVPGSQLGRLRLGHGAAGHGPPLPGAVSAVPARGSAARLRGRDGHDTVARRSCPATAWVSSPTSRATSAADTFRGRGHGEGDRGVRADAAGPEALRPPHVARAAEAARAASIPEPYWKVDARDGEAVRQAGRLPRADERSRHRGAGAARLRPRQGADGARCAAASGSAARASARSVHEEPRYDHPVLPGRLPRAERAPRRGARRQSARRVRGHVHVRLLGRGPHLALHATIRSRTGRRRSARSCRMFEVQLEHWKKTPLVTNTQPDWSRVGNSELVDRTIRSHNWLRTDTIFVENEQIEAISNRPPWVAAVLEVGMSDGSPESLRIDEGVTYTDNVIAHVMDVGANYWSLWNWHEEKAENVLALLPPVPGDDRHHRAAHRATACGRRSSGTTRAASATGSWSASPTTASPGCPACSGVEVVETTEGRCSGRAADSTPAIRCRGRSGRPASPLPRGTDWKGLRLSAEIEVKGVRHPVRWACHQALEEDGSLRLRRTRRAGIGGWSQSRVHTDRARRPAVRVTWASVEVGPANAPSALAV